MSEDITTFWRRLDTLRETALAGDRAGAEALLTELTPLAQAGVPGLGAGLGAGVGADMATGATRLELLGKLAQTFGLDFAAPSGVAPRTETESEPESGSNPGPAVSTWELGPITAEAQMPGISLVTCAMNREENLLRALATWLACPEIAEIVIIDWSSTAPVAEALARAGIADPRIRLVRVEGEPRWVLSWAFNAGFRLAKGDRILKADADIVLDGGFFAQNHLAPGRFIAGNWRNAEEGQAHVNGFFFVHRADLAAVGGFNEQITTYGWDDDDLYTRLVEAGAERQDVAAGTIRHLDHSDEARLGETRLGETRGAIQSAAEEIRADTMHKIRANRLLSYLMPWWGPEKIPVPFGVAENGGVPVLRRAEWLPHEVPAHTQADAEHYALREIASWRLGPQVLGLERTALDALLAHPFAALGPDQVAAAQAGTLPAPKTAPKTAPQTAPKSAPMLAPMLAPGRPRLFIDGQHGLGNRLRAIGSGAAIAEKTGRELVIVWEPDHHCDCRMSDLFDYDGAVIEEAFYREAESRGAALYNYMEVEEGGEKDAPIRDADGDIYARSAYVLQSPHSTWEAENHFLRALTPVDAVRDMVAGVRTPNDVSAHVRMVGGADYEHLAYESLDNWTEEGHQLTDFWRKKSHFKHFIARLDTLIAEGRADRIFVAADKPETYDEFRACFGDRLAMLERAVYDRSAEQLRYALADVLLLGSAPLLLGSSWSSFSELAMRMAPHKMEIEMSGKDF